MSSEKWTVRSSKGTAERGDQGLVLDVSDSNNNKRMNVEEWSRLQSAVKVYSATIADYKIGDFVLFNDTLYRNTTTITVAEDFDPAKWIEVNGGNKVIFVKNANRLPNAVLATLASITDAGGSVALFTTTGNHTYTEKQTVQLEGTDAVIRIKVTSGGAGYGSVPTVVIGGPGTGAAATATVVGGVVTSILVTNIGSGYTTIPTISFTGGTPTTAATARVQEFHVIEKVTDTTFQINGVVFSQNPAKGDLTRCLAFGGAQYIIEIPIFTPLGYRGVAGDPYSLLATATFNNNITMVGTGQTFFTQKIGGSLGSNTIQIIDAFKANTLYDVEHSSALTDIISRQRALTLNFSSLGTIKDTFLVSDFSPDGFFNTGLTLVDCQGTIDNIPITATNPGVVGLTVDSPTPNKGAVVITGINPTMAPGTSVLDIKPTNDETNSVTISNGGKTSGAYFKPGTEEVRGINEIGPATIPVVGEVVVGTDFNNTFAVGQFVTITNTIHHNGTFKIKTIVLADEFIIESTRTETELLVGTATQKRQIEKVSQDSLFAGDITSMSAGAPGFTVVAAASIGTDLVNGDSVTITEADAIYNGTFDVTGVINNTSFIINVTFGATSMGRWGKHGRVDDATTGGTGKTLIESTDVDSTILKNGDSVQIRDTTLYDGIHIVESVIDNTSFVIPVPHTGTPTAGGEWERTGIDIVITNHGLTNDTPVLVDQTLNYDGGYLVRDATTNTITLLGTPFVADESVGEVKDGSLDQTNKLVLLNTVSGEANSKAKAHVIAINTGTAVDLSDNEFHDFAFTTAPATGVPPNAFTGTGNQLWKTSNPLNGETEYIGDQPIRGADLVAALGLLSTGTEVTHTIRALKNGGVMVDGFEFPIDVGSNVQGIPFSVGVSVDKGDKFRLQFRRDSGNGTATCVTMDKVIS